MNISSKSKTPGGYAQSHSLQAGSLGSLQEGVSTDLVSSVKDTLLDKSSNIINFIKLQPSYKKQRRPSRSKAGLEQYIRNKTKEIDQQNTRMKNLISIDRQQSQGFK